MSLAWDRCRKLCYSTAIETRITGDKERQVLGT
uniref:Uncharacterized protein n=1 Tax=Arundo donax TaxID=35708 RepID=A0A0A9D5L1_ARUDO